jgi:hypothetical protein
MKLEMMYRAADLSNAVSSVQWKCVLVRLIDMKSIEKKLWNDLLRIRNNAEIHELKFTDEQLAKVKYASRLSKNRAVRENLNVGTCCVCGDVPNYEIKSDVQGARKIEYFCDTCVKSIFTREDEMYGCIKVDSIPASKYNVWD